MHRYLEIMHQQLNIQHADKKNKNKIRKKKT